MSGHVTKPAHGLADGAERRFITVWSILAVAGDSGDDQARICFQEDIRPDLQPFQLAGPEIFDQDVGSGDEFEQDIPVLFQIQLDRQLVAAVNAEPDGMPIFRCAPATERVTTGRFELDDLGTEIGKDLGAKGRRYVVANF